MGTSCQILVLNASSDADIYENIKQTSLCEVISETWCFWPRVYSRGPRNTFDVLSEFEEFIRIP